MEAEGRPQVLLPVVKYLSTTQVLVLVHQWRWRAVGGTRRRAVGRGDGRCGGLGVLLALALLLLPLLLVAHELVVLDELRVHARQLRTHQVRMLLGNVERGTVEVAVAHLNLREQLHGLLLLEHQLVLVRRTPHVRQHLLQLHLIRLVGILMLLTAGMELVS